MTSSGKFVVWGISLVVVLTLVLLLAPFTIVSSGEEAVVLNLGRVDRTLSPGMHWVTPITESVETFNVAAQKEQVDASAASSDLQSVNVTIAVQYNLDPAHVADLWKNFRGDQKSVAIDPAIQEAVKAATAKYTAEELITKRDQVSGDILENLKARLSTNDILVSNVSIVDFKFSPSFEASIEAKVTAEQNALASKNKLEQATYDAQAIRVTSEAANNEKYIELQTLKVQQAAIDKWDGRLPTQMIPGTAVPFINVGSK